MVDFDGFDWVIGNAASNVSSLAIVVMGVSGSGKSMLGGELAKAMGLEFIEGDALHPDANVAKMTSGVALTDDDRWPWLERVADALTAPDSRGVVVSCSALKRTYRDFLRARVGETLVFVFPDVSRDVLMQRMRNRPDHYMPPSLLDSQMATFERPGADEAVLILDGTADRDLLLAELLKKLVRWATDRKVKGH